MPTELEERLAQKLAKALDQEEITFLLDALEKSQSVEIPGTETTVPTGVDTLSETDADVRNILRYKDVGRGFYIVGSNELVKVSRKVVKPREPKKLRIGQVVISQPKKTEGIEKGGSE